MRSKVLRKTLRFFRPRTREGSALLIALLAMAGLSILGVSLMMVSDTELNVSNDERLRKQALYAAEAGIEHALIYIRNMDTKTNIAYDGALNGNVIANWAGGPPPEDKSYNEPIVPTQNLANATYVGQRPAMMRKGNVLEFKQGPAWFPNGGGPSADFIMRDVNFEQNAGGAGAFDVGTFKSRYTVYVKNNSDDPSINGINGQFSDQDRALVLTGQGIIQVANRTAGATEGYRVTREVEVTVRINAVKTYDDHCSAAGCGGTNNSLWNDDQSGGIQLNINNPTLAGPSGTNTW